MNTSTSVDGVRAASLTRVLAVALTLALALITLTPSPALANTKLRTEKCNIFFYDGYSCSRVHYFESETASQRWQNSLYYVSNSRAEFGQICDWDSYWYAWNTNGTNKIGNARAQIRCTYYRTYFSWNEMSLKVGDETPLRTYWKDTDTGGNWRMIRKHVVGRSYSGYYNN